MTSINQSSPQSSPFTLPAVASNDRLLWLDSWDASTITRCDDRLIQWTRKDGSGASAIASAPAYSFGANLDQAVQSSSDKWRSSCVSKDGTVAVCMSDDISTRSIISYNGGQTFGSIDGLDSVAGATVWSEISMSVDATTMVVGGVEGPLMVSTNKGLTWQAKLTDTGRFWEWTSVSDDGQHMLASCFGDYVYASSDGGSTWRQLTQFPTDETDAGFVWVAPSGQQQMVGFYGGSLYVSNNYGASFADTTISGFWFDVVAAAGLLVPFTSPGYIYQSSDAGATFAPILSDVQRDFLAVSISSNGRIIAAAAGNDSIYVSSNSGGSWGVLNTGPRDWSSMVMNANGEIFATESGMHAPFMWRNGILTTGTVQTNVVRSDIQSAVAIDPSGRTLIVGGADGSVWVNQVSREPLLARHALKSCVDFEHSQLDVPSPVFTGPSSTDFTCVMAVSVTAANNAPCLTIGDGHGLLLTSASMQLQWGGSQAPAAVTNRGLVAEEWTIVAFRVGSVVDPVLRVYLNGSKMLDKVGNVTEPDGAASLRFGGTTDDDDFSGVIGEVLVYRGDLQANLTGWNDVHAYLGRKFTVYAAVPQLSGIGSDPHLRQLTGGTFDVTQPGDYTLLHLDAFKMTCHISSIKQGIFMDTLTVTNGSQVARATFKSRGLKLGRGAGPQSGHELGQDLEETIKWDVYPSAPRRFVKVLRGRHPRLGQFWIRLDYKHRYMTPYFPSFNDWSVCDGILVGAPKRRLHETLPKQIMRVGKQL